MPKPPSISEEAVREAAYFLVNKGWRGPSNHDRCVEKYGKPEFTQQEWDEVAAELNAELADALTAIYPLLCGEVERLRVEVLRDQLDEAADKAPTLEDLASLLQRDGSAEVRENVVRDLNEIADMLGKLPQRAITDHDGVLAVHGRAEQAEQELERVRAVVDEFDSWLSLRGEFTEVLRAFRDAFGTEPAWKRRPEPDAPSLSGGCEQIDDAEFGCGGSGTADPGSCPDGCPDCTANSPSTEPCYRAGDGYEHDADARPTQSQQVGGELSAEVRNKLRTLARYLEYAHEDGSKHARLGDVAFLRNLASRLSPENSSGVEGEVSVPRSALICVMAAHDHGAHTVDGPALRSAYDSLRAASTQPDATTHLSEGTRDRLEAAGREFDTRVKNQESVHEPLPEDRIREIYESHATTPQPQDEEER